LSITSISTSSTYTLVSDTESSPNSNSSFSIHLSPDLTGDTPRNLGDLKNISVGTVPLTIPTGTNPYQMVTIGNYTYVANQGSNNVTIFNNTTNTVVGTTTVGSQPYGMAYNSTSKEIYVANLKGNSVSVIDADPANTGTWNTVTHTIDSTHGSYTGVEPYYVTSLGTKMYVTNNLSWTVSEINTTTHAVTDTINVGAYPRGIKALGSKLYVANFGSSYGGHAQGTVSIIDTTNGNSVTTINVGSGPRGVTTNGTDVYVANFNDNTVSRIDTANSNTVTTIAVGTNPRGIMTLNNKIYVQNYQDGTISIIDGTSHNVTGSYKVGNTPSGMTAIGNDIAISRFTDGVVSIFDTTTLALREPGAAGDVIAPVITLTATSTTATTSLITFTTDEAATSTVSYGTSTSYTLTSATSTATTTHSITLSSLTASTTYHYMITSVDEAGNIATTTDATFTTAAITPVLHTVVTGSSTSTTASTTLLTGNLTSTGTQTVIVRGFQYATDSGYSDAQTVFSSDNAGFATGTYSLPVTGLTCNTTYYYAAYASSNPNYVVGSTETFTTSACPITLSTPTLTIQSATSISTTTATLNGSITSDGNASSTVRGFNYGTTTTYTATTSVGGSLGITTFSDTVTGLTCNTTYHYRAYATNSQGTGTSSDATFTTSACPVEEVVVTPTVTTIPGSWSSPTSGGSGGSSSSYSAPTVTSSPVPTPTQPVTPTTPTSPNLKDLFTTPTGTPFVFKTNLTVSPKQNPDIQKLQKLLNTLGFTVAKTGAGSVGKETSTFGKATQNALMKFQKAQGIKPASGVFGPATQAKVNALLKGR
jgi:YVTN family beta-propeller protein